jgi:hypothetical protein
VVDVADFDNRPTVRPAHQRYPQPPFVFPITPPNTAGLETLIKRNEEEDASQRGSLWTAARSPPPTPLRRAADQYFSSSKACSQPQTRHRRAHSYSTVDDHHAPIQDSDYGAFKVIIERPGTEGRPKTAEELSDAPVLEVNIPSYRIGVPRFSMRGTAFIRSSSYSATDDMRSSIFTEYIYDAPQRDRNSLHPGAMIPRRHSQASPQIQYLRVSPTSPLGSSLPSPTMMNPRLTIEPAMYDALTFKPACDDRSVVRYSAVGGTITAATPPRLIAEITSPSFVDYDLLSDFFLTFRSFLPTSHLLAMLIARLRWALARDDEVGMVVRVRTFVAMRHWILNYFLDDFVVNYELRLLFCELLNDFVDEIIQSSASGRSRLKIVGELKKCWRRTCALYWDGDEFSVDAGPEIAIKPGGIAGSREPHLTPSFWEMLPDPGAPRLESIIDHDTPAPSDYNFFTDVSRAGHLDSLVVDPQTPTHIVEGNDPQQDPPLSPQSMLSEDFISCSFPTRSRFAQAGNQHPLGAHPVPSSSKYDSVPVAYIPQAVRGERTRPTHSHKRSGSFSDSLRDERRQPVQTVVYKSTEILMALPFAGSLVRGNLFPPGQAFVEALPPSTPGESLRATAYFNRAAANQKGPSAMSSPGMKKLLGSVRRALSKKAGAHYNSSPTQGSFPHIPPLGARGVTVNRLPGTAVVPQERTRDQGTRPTLRIDILGAGIAEDFKKAVREDEEADADRRERESHPSIGVASGNEAMYPSMQPDTTPDSEKLQVSGRAVSALTSGSKSIVIVDDTLPPELPMMRGALPVNPSTDTFADAFMQPSAGPTPPSTPPEMPVGSPRRSSHLLGQTSYNRNRSLSPERTPSLIRSPSEVEQSPSHRPFGRTAMRSYGRSFRSNRSVSLRRYASYQSGFTRHATERSFDATTFSGSGERASMIEAAPEPLRVLRRRPGGDLRAVTNVGDLHAQPPRRRGSTGSLTTYSDSVRSSYLVGEDSSGYVGVVHSDDYSQTNQGTFSLGALAAPPKRGVSLFSTHSSQPVMRPSFEAEAAKLAQIPDDDDDDGGVESALLKLEGKFEQRKSDISASSLMQAAPASPPQSIDAAPIDVLTGHSAHLDDMFDDDSRRRHRHKQIVENNLSKTPPLLDSYRPEPPRSPVRVLKPTVYQPRKVEVTARSVGSHDSEESLPFLPVLEPDNTYTAALPYTGAGHRHSRDWTNSSILRGLSKDRDQQRERSPLSSHPSIDFCDIIDGESLRPQATSGPVQGHDSVDQSFLDSDSDEGSSISSEMSLEVISRTEYIGDGSTSTFPPIASGTVIKEIALPPHPLRQPSPPSMNIDQALLLSPDTANIPEVHAHQLHQQRKLPPTPEITPTAAEAISKRSWEKVDEVTRLSASNKPAEASRTNSVHLPFILAFDSKILAQQFTLIEKDALNEIDWKELIDMRWKNTSTNPRSWVDFLRTQEARGVEVVIARFNIMVKWAVSECVLTQNIEERVQTIVKYIHIAAHCRRYRNYATMYQLTVALTSNDLVRLSKTWSQVPSTDLATLKELENLVQPSKNFYKLRAEMEGSGGDQGCIPFVGIYTHDLLFNSQRPSQIASTPTTEPLVNFEKCRTTAAIVKNLLRLLEASSLYRFQPIEGITERCLWMAALSDEEIRKCGALLE